MYKLLCDITADAILSRPVVSLDFNFLSAILFDAELKGKLVYRKYLQHRKRTNCILKKLQNHLDRKTNERDYCYYY